MTRMVWLRLAAFGVAATAAVAAPAAANLTSSSGTSAIPAPRADAQATRSASSIRSLDPSRSIDPSRVSAVLADLTRAGTTGSRLTALTDAPGMPACAPPPIPQSTFPPGSGYGVPFLAAITNGQVLAGYDEWTANNLVWKTDKMTFDLYPWQSKIFDITGWVTGLLQLPSLTAEIPPQDVVFCDNQGGASCLSADWPAGECIQIQAQYGPSPASKIPPPALGSYHPEGTACSDYTTPTFECFPYVVSLAPSGTTTLTVTGVEPDGALDLSVSTAAVTTVSEVPPPPSTTTYTCQAAPTSVTLSTQATPLPATAPGPPVPPNTDDRPLQTLPEPVTGPLSSSISTVASNDFSIPAFVPSAGGSPCSVFLATSLNTYAGGWNSIFKDQGTGMYYVDGGTNPIAAEPGWGQFTATTTVVSLGLPVGPPPGFSL
jgi:hypothetical protein